MFKNGEEGKIRKIELLNLTIIKNGNDVTLQDYKTIGSKKINIRFMVLTLLTETCVNVEEYGGHSEAVVPLMAVVC